MTLSMLQVMILNTTKLHSCLDRALVMGYVPDYDPGSRDRLCLVTLMGCRCSGTHILDCYCS